MTTQLAIIDWGIVGLGIYKQLKAELREIPVCYLSDTGAVPYGRMNAPALTDRLNAAISFLKRLDVTHLVIGCNAASTALPFLERNGIEIEGVIDSAVDFAADHKPRDLGVIGGRRTVLSGVYRKAFEQKGFRVKQRVAQPLSALIESGDTSSKTLRAECKRILGPLRNCSHILLACTHYPAISDILGECVDQSTVLIDPSTALVTRIKRWRLQPVGNEIFMTTGDPAAMKRAGKLAFGIRIDNVKKVRF